MPSALRIPVIGYLIPFNEKLFWLEQGTITARIAYDEQKDEWAMVKKGTPNSIVLFDIGNRDVESRKYLRVLSIGKTGQFVNAEFY